jgi:hypothetical protein
MASLILKSDINIRSFKQLTKYQQKRYMINLSEIKRLKINLKNGILTDNSNTMIKMIKNQGLIKSI